MREGRGRASVNVVGIEGERAGDVRGVEVVEEREEVVMEVDTSRFGILRVRWRMWVGDGSRRRTQAEDGGGSMRAGMSFLGAKW